MKTFTLLSLLLFSFSALATNPKFKIYLLDENFGKIEKTISLNELKDTERVWLDNSSCTVDFSAVHEDLISEKEYTSVKIRVFSRRFTSYSSGTLKLKGGNINVGTTEGAFCYVETF